MGQQARAEGLLNLDKDMAGAWKLRLVEIGLALVLTFLALLFLTLGVLAKEPSAITISDSWARPSLGNGTVTAAYLTLGNSGSTGDVLKSVKTDQAQRVEIHETKMSDDGIMQMRELKDGLSIPAGGSVQLKPGGAHFMVMGLNEKLAMGDTLTLTLEFEKSGPMEISIPVGKTSDAKAGH